MTIYELYNAIFEAALIENPDIPVIMNGKEVEVSFSVKDGCVDMVVKGKNQKAIE